MSNQKTVLFLLAEFPPVNTTGAFRSYKFVNQLIDLGIQPIILTLDENDSSTYFNAKIDYEVLKGLDHRVTIYRVNISNLNKIRLHSKLASFLQIYFSIKDPLSGMIKKSILDVLPEIFEKHHPEKVYVSLPPFSMGELGIFISKKYRIPLVSDMRDLWAYWGSDPHQTYLHFLLKKRLERNLFRKSSNVIGVTPQLNRIFKQSHPKISSDKFVTIFNGFDKEINANTINTYSKTTLKIGYTGSFYYNEKAHSISKSKWYKRSGLKKFYYYPKNEDWLYRSPYFYLKALHQLFVLKPELKSKIEFHFIGFEPAWLKKMIEEFNLEENYFPYGFKSKQEVSGIQETFDVFLCTSEKVIGEDHYCLPSKLFDYIDLGKPVLAFITNGIQKEFILQSNLGIVCNPDNQKECIQAILDLFNYQGAQVNKTFLQAFGSNELSLELRNILIR